MVWSTEAAPSSSESRQCDRATRCKSCLGRRVLACPGQGTRDESPQDVSNNRRVPPEGLRMARAPERSRVQVQRQQVRVCRGEESASDLEDKLRSSSTAKRKGGSFGRGRRGPPVRLPTRLVAEVARGNDLQGQSGIASEGCARGSAMNA